jgi:hypothetical protein
VEHAQESEAPTSTCVGHALVRGGSVATRRAATSGGKAEKGGREACCWPSKPKRNRSNLDQTGSKMPMVTKTKEKGDN